MTHIPDRTLNQTDAIPSLSEPQRLCGPDCCSDRRQHPDLQAGGHGASVQIGGNNEAMQNYFNNL